MSESTKHRRPLARHGQLGSPGAGRQLLKLLGLALSVVLLSGVAVGGYVLYSLASTVSANAVELQGQKELPPDIAAYEGGFDVFVAGVDTCEPKYAHLFGKRCTGADSEGTLNDVNLLVHVSAAPRRVTVVSFPRDILVPIPACKDEKTGKEHPAMSRQPLNSAWDYGGLNCAVQTVSQLTGEDIEFAASFTFGGVIEMTNAIGGVDVCLANPIKDKYTGLDLSAGNHTVQGLEALQFLRTRHGVGDGSDLGRIGNQQQYMSSLARKMVSGETLGNVPVLLKLANAAADNLTMSTSLADPSRMVQIALAMKEVPLDDIVFVQYPTVDAPENPNKVVPNKQAAEQLWAAIKANKQLQITHENSKNEGVIVTTPAPTTNPGTPSTTPTDVVQLPSDVKGNSAAQQTCSNGNVRR
ncbi:LCP family protein [Microbacterium sp.]|uniref:LCP family protein n=1 Tax=Microbacterium sp. TaxID=51671 RepID=UPI003341CDCF